MNTEKELSYKEFVMRENSEFHAPYHSEFVFYHAVKNGDLYALETILKTEFKDQSGFGKLSEHPLQNMKYHFVITAALVARYCIEGGMEHETAYNLSDLYIQRVDSCKTIAEISKLHADLSFDYAHRMKDLRKKHIISKHISRCIDYIYDNLHTRVRIADLAEFTGLNASYLSRLFKQELGTTITDYVQKRKIETAKNMLKYSEYLPSQISNILCFSSQSYFIDVFKKQVGMTPKQYQDLYYRDTGIRT